jgi:hypothetical protein
MERVKSRRRTRTAQPCRAASQSVDMQVEQGTQVLGEAASRRASLGCPAVWREALGKKRCTGRKEARATSRNAFASAVLEEKRRVT